MSPNLDLDLETTNQSFCNTAAHDDAPPYEVELQKTDGFRRYCPDKTGTQRSAVIPI